MRIWATVIFAILTVGLTAMTLALRRMHLVERVYRELFNAEPPPSTRTSTIFLVAGLVLAAAVGVLTIWVLGP